MEYCNITWAGAAKSSLTTLDRLQRRLHSIVDDKFISTLQIFSHK